MNISSNLTEVEHQISKLALMDGNTEWGSPLATCHQEMSRARNTKNGTKRFGVTIMACIAMAYIAHGTCTTKRFCVLISDGKPNRDDTTLNPPGWTAEDTTPEMQQFCKASTIYYHARYIS